MGERPDEIEHEISEKRSELNQNFAELEDKVKSFFDWRAQFEERPGTMLALAFGSGAVVSAIFPPRRRRPAKRVRDQYGRRLNEHRRDGEWEEQNDGHEREAGAARLSEPGWEEDEETYRASTSYGTEFGSGSNFRERRRKTGRSLEAFGGALLGVAVNRLTGFLDALLPGFEQEFFRQKSERGWERPGGSDREDTRDDFASGGDSYAGRTASNPVHAPSGQRLDGPGSTR